MEQFYSHDSSEDEWYFFFVTLSGKEAVATKLSGKIRPGTELRVIRVRDWRVATGDPTECPYLVETGYWDFDPDADDWSEVFSYVGLPANTDAADYPPDGLFEMRIHYMGIDDPGECIDTDEELAAYLLEEGVPESVLHKEGFL